MKDPYLLVSERLGFRNWKKDDLSAFAKLNADVEVMEHFPAPLTEQETAELIERFQKHYERHGYTYFATEIRETGELIGFIGLAYQEYPAEFTPATDIGWRLKKSAWGRGYATEGAKRCLEFAFNELQLKSVFSICTENNTRSENVMKKLGMFKQGMFHHPKLKDYPQHRKCVWYEIKK